MKKHIIFLFCGIICIPTAFAQYKYTFDKAKNGFVLVSSTSKFGESSTFGFDFDTDNTSGKPFFFSVKVPEGNYSIKVTLGNKKTASNTTVKAESRRLMLLNVETKKGEFVEKTFNLNIRNKYFETDSVRINPREAGKLIWDDKLTLEFNGLNPSVTTIEIDRADDLPTIFLAGNSTVVDEGNEPWCGWGQIFPYFINDKAVVANYAESGQAANSFVSSKRLAKLLTKIKAGDYLFIEFGHNDQKQKGIGLGAFTSYRSNIEYLIYCAQEKGAIPVLVTPMNRRRFDANGKVINTHEDYPDAMRLTAKKNEVPLIDLHAMSKVLYEAWGVEGSKKAFVHYPPNTFPNQDKALEDNTHFNPYGGYEIARCIIKGIVDAQIPLVQYIKPEFLLFDPSNPDSFESINIPQSPFYTAEKPLGN